MSAVILFMVLHNLVGTIQQHDLPEEGKRRGACCMIALSCYTEIFMRDLSIISFEGRKEEKKKG